MLARILLLAFGGTASFAVGQQFARDVVSEPVAPSPVIPDDTQPSGIHKRVLGIIPNYRTWPSLANYKPLSAKEKFEIARQDSFDRGTGVLAAALGGYSQFKNSDPSFGQGIVGYAHYSATAYGDLVIGNYMSEAVFPALLHQDPRYFRRGVGSFPSRLAYSVGRTFWTRIDSGGTRFNYSEILGNATAVAISNAYYPDNRSVSDSGTKLGIQLGVDMVSNILKEFWPNVSRRFARKHPAQAARI